MVRKNKKKQLEREKRLEKNRLEEKEFYEQFRNQILEILNDKLNKYLVNIIHDCINYSNNNLLKLYNNNCSNKKEVINPPLFELMIKAIQLGYGGIGYRKNEVLIKDRDDFLNNHNNFKHNIYNGYECIMIKGMKNDERWINIFLLYNCLF